MHRDMLLALVAPGWAARERGRWMAAMLLVAGVVVPVLIVGYVVVTDRNRVALGLDQGFLALVMLVGVGALAARAIALVEIWFAAGRPRPLARPELLAMGAAVLALVLGGVVVVQVGRSRAALEPAFAGTSAAPLFDAAQGSGSASDGAEARTATTVEGDALRDGADETPPVGSLASGDERTDDATPGLVATTTSTSTTTTTTTTVPLPTRPDSGVSDEALADVTTVLLLGGDAGPGRFGLRTDTMMLFSLHEPSGRAALVSLPRDMRRLLFPPGSALEAMHPYGFDDLANAVYPIVSSRPGLRAEYDVPGVRPGVVAIAEGIGYSLDTTIDDYVLVDMQGFIELVDALGGVTVDVYKQIPMPGNVPGAPTQYPETIGPGRVAMDGSTALGYVRSRYADNDFRRTERQRRLLAALAQQVSASDLLLSFPSVASAVGGTLRTSLDPGELTNVLEVIGGETAIVESVGLVPPLVDIDRPDFDTAAKVVGSVHLALVTGEPSGF